MPTHAARFKRRHTPAQKLIVVVNCLLAVACFAGGTALVLGERLVSSQQKSAPVVNLAKAEAMHLGPAEAFPEADAKAMNFLITGADNNACIAADSPFAGAFGDRSSTGQRSDTIINSAYVRNKPNTLIRTIYDNFGIGIDHFIQVDFCAFKTLVDAVGGVAIPFEYPTRDTHTGLTVPAPGCFNLSGDHALAYVRSRHYEYLSPKTGKWVEDGFADLGRISRQQDFLRRVVAKALATGVYTPSIARGLIRTAQQYVVTDPDLTLQKMLEFAGVIKALDQGNLRTYQIEVKSETRGANLVLIPRMNGGNMQAVISVFRGRAPLLETPKEPSNAPVAAPATPAAAPAPAATTATTAAPQGGDGAEENVKGIVPPRDVRC